MIHLALALVMQRWLVVNDVHLDPFSKSAVVYGADTSPSLWRSAVRAMRADVPDARVVILGGDELAHHFRGLARAAGRDPVASALATEETVAHDLGDAFPRAQFLVALGNNDDPCGDYRSEVSGPYQERLGRIWAPLVDRNGAAPDFSREFLQGGYYTARLPIRSGRAIVLNSVLWSFVYAGGCLSKPHDPGAAELTWLQSRLAALPRDTNAMIVMHIPPGYDPQSTTAVHRFVAVPFLGRASNAALLRIFAANARALRFIVAAHTHRYDFRVAGGVPMLIASSISPIYRNNPAFYVLDVDENGVLHDVQPYVYDPGADTWNRAPSFDATYGVRALTRDSLAAVSANLREDPSLRVKWSAAYDAWSRRVAGIGANWRPYVCAQTELEGGYAGCAGTSRRSRVLAATVICGLLAFIAVLAWIVMKRRPRRSQ